jgi:Caspase domain
MRVGPNWGYFSMRVAFVVSLTLAAAATALLPASAQQSNGSCAALLIGNSNYMWGGEPPLKEPINDARSLGEELKRAGFDVDVTEDLSKEAMQRAVDGFYGKLRTGMTGLIFFSGYGIQANRQSYLIPIDVDIFNESEVRPNGISLDNVLAEMNRRGAGVKIAIIDAARRFNPFENRFRRPGAGLAPVSSPGGALVMYSATAGTPGGLVPASSAERGLFVGELLKEIRVQGVSAEEAFNRTRMRVSQASSNDQNPSATSNLRLLGPLVGINGSGSIDLAAKTLRFKLDPKLVASLQGQGGAPDPLGFGVPVNVEGSWSDRRAAQASGRARRCRGGAHRRRRP